MISHAVMVGASLAVVLAFNIFLFRYYIRKEIDLLRNQLTAKGCGNTTWRYIAAPEACGIVTSSAELLRLGLRYEQLGDTANARYIFVQLVTNHPTTKESKRAEQRLEELRSRSSTGGKYA